MPSKTEFLRNLEERFAEAKEVKGVADELVKAGYEAYLVGGCLRDLLLQSMEPARSTGSGLAPAGPKDWDIATNARPEEVQKVFGEESAVYENDFGTVGVKTESDDPRQKIVEVTTFRLEGKYTDKRHPDEVKFAKTIEEDLARRDFTVNAVAFRCDANLRMHANAANNANRLIDPFGGFDDLKQKVVRAVGNPEERFTEDALRLMRAPRFSVELGFKIEAGTRKAIGNLAGELRVIAKERIRDEFIKILETRDAARGVILLEDLNLLRHVLPELREGLGVEQNKHHKYTVFEHSVRALDYAAKQGYPPHIRLAALLHDAGKPKSRAWQDDEEGQKVREGRRGDWTFHQHQYIGERMAFRALDRLRFPKDFTEKVALLVREHMFNYAVGEVKEAGVRRILARVGPDNIDDLIRVREADRIGSGVEKAVPYKLRHFKFMIDKVKRDPVSVKMLKVGGGDVMKILGIEPGPRVGWILAALLDEVLDEPKKNSRENLEERIEELGKLSDDELRALAEAAKKKKDEAQQEIEEEMKKRYYVK